MKKKIKDGSLYYRQKDIIRPLGAILLIVGLVWFWLGRGMGMGMISYIIPITIVPVGLVLYLIGSTKHISDNDILELQNHAMRDYDKAITDMDGYDRVVLRQPAPVETEAYSFGPDAAYFKRGKNSTPISDRFTRTHFFFTRDSLLVVSRSLSVAELNEEEGQGISDYSEHLALAGITSATLEEHADSVTLTNTGKVTTVKWCELVLTAAEGELLRVPVRNDMDMAAVCDHIERFNGRA